PLVPVASSPPSGLSAKTRIEPAGRNGLPMSSPVTVSRSSTMHLDELVQPVASFLPSALTATKTTSPGLRQGSKRRLPLDVFQIRDVPSPEPVAKNWPSFGLNARE